MKQSFIYCTKVFMLILIALQYSGFILKAQTISVRGSVKDYSGSLIPGVTIFVKGTSNVTTSDADGMFILSNVMKGDTIVFSCIGMKTLEIISQSADLGEIMMEIDAIGLDEVVTIGYSSTTKKEVTGSIASISSNNFIQGNMISPLGAIQGKVAGLTIQNSNGNDPTADFTILIRGLNSLSGGKSPLIIVDGVIWGGSLSMISQDEIETIDILKDGSAAAIYGTRATNGVIMITTKKPEKGTVKFDFSATIGVEQVNKDKFWMNADDYRAAIKNFAPEQSSLDFRASTNWLETVSRIPINQNYNLSITGGKDDIAFRTNFYYKDNQGIFPKSSSKVMSPSIYVTQKAFNNRLNIDYKLLYSKTNNQFVPEDLLSQIMVRNPTEPVYNEDGSYYDDQISGSKNPVAMINESDKKRTIQFVNASLNAMLDIVKGLSFKLSYSFSSWNGHDSNYTTSKYPLLGKSGRAYIGNWNTYNYVIEPSLTYKIKINGHTLNTIAGFSFTTTTNMNSSMQNSNFDTDIFGVNNIGSGADLINGLASITSFRESSRLVAFYGRISYNYRDKYLASLSIRQEGSSKFGKNNKWGTFPAISIGWRINEENWMEDAEWIDNLKIRAGIGVTGNQNIPNYQSIPRLTLGHRLFYYNGKWMNNYVPANNPNPDLKWEIKTEYNVGLDFGIFNRFSLSVDLYSRNISDLLWWYNVPVPPNVYNNIYANVGVMRNSGYEIQFSGDIIKNKSFSWTSNIAVCQNKNIIKSLSDPSRGYELEYIRTTPAATSWAQMLRENESIGNFWAPIYEGVDEKGKIIYKDVNGDGVVDPNSSEDREIVGNEYPKVELNWANNFSYKNLYLNFSFRSLLGQSLLNYERMSYENWSYFTKGQNILKSAIKHPENKSEIKYDNRFVDKASFLKLDNLVIGYAFNINKVRFNVYLSGNNLLTITKYKGSDPERISPGFNTDTEKFGWTNMTYPYSRSFILGFKLQF